MARASVKSANRGSYKIYADKDTDDHFRMVRDEWNDRFEKQQAQFIHEAAKFVFLALQENLPQGDDYREYRKAFRLANVKGTRKGVPETVIYVKPSKTGKRELDGTKTLLYIRPRRRLARPDPGVRVLTEYSPWTVDTVPFIPSKRLAVITYRKVTEREVLSIAEKRKQDEPAWRRQLTKLGIRDSKRKRLEIAKKLAAVPDFAFTALRLEFGGVGERAKPHWRPAISALIKGAGPRRLMANKGLNRALMDPRFNKWRKWPTKTRLRIPLRLTRSFRAFEKRLGIR